MANYKTFMVAAVDEWMFIDMKPILHLRWLCGHALTLKKYTVKNILS
jgi:hypothetical protein